MESLQALSCSVISLHPEITMKEALIYLNLPCLEQVVNHLSMNDLLKYHKELKERGIDSEAVIHNCQWKLLMPILDSHMASTVCPHLLDLSPRNGCNWGLSRSLSRTVIRNVVEHFHGFSPIKNDIFGNSTQHSVLQSHDCVLKLFCPPVCSVKDLEKRRNNLPGDALWILLMLAAKNIFSISVDLKFCEFLLHPQFKPVLDIFLDSLQILSLLLKSSHLVLDVIRIFKDRGKSLKHICLYLIRHTDMLYFDEVLSVCSCVVGFYRTTNGQTDKVALHSILSSLDQSLNEKLEAFKCHHENSKEHSNLKDYFEETPLESLGASVEKGSAGDTDGGFNAQSCSASDFDLMDDAVLFGTASPPSSLDSLEGCAKVEIKITNLVQTSLWAPLLNHHFTHWLALKELQLGVPNLEPLTVQGIVCLLKRVQFSSFALSSTTVSHREIEEILSAVASFRVSHPLQRLMFVSIAITIEDSCFESGLNELFGSAYQGTELLEICSCGFDVQTENLFLQFMSQNLALKTLCLSNNIMLTFGKAALHGLTVNDVGQNLHSLILEDWPINSSNCSILKDLLTKMAHSLTSLSLKGCLIDRNNTVFSEIVSGISVCTSLQTLDLSGNSLGKYGAQFSGMFLRLVQLKELSLKGNRLPADVVTGIITELKELSKQRGFRMKVLDMRGNTIVKSRNGSQPSTLRTLQQSFAEKVIFHMEDS